MVLRRVVRGGFYWVRATQRTWVFSSPESRSCCGTRQREKVPALRRGRGRRGTKEREPHGTSPLSHGLDMIYENDPSLRGATLIHKLLNHKSFYPSSTLFYFPLRVCADTREGVCLAWVRIPNLGALLALTIIASVSLTHLPCLFACFYESVSCVGRTAARRNAPKQLRAMRVGPHQGKK